MDRTAGTSGLDVIKPFVNAGIELHFPDLRVGANLDESMQSRLTSGRCISYCALAYNLAPRSVDRRTLCAESDGQCPIHTDGHVAIAAGYTGFDPSDSAEQWRPGFAKNVGGNELPNAPPFTVSSGAQYTMPLTPDWAGTLRGDYLLAGFFLVARVQRQSL